MSEKKRKYRIIDKRMKPSELNELLLDQYGHGLAAGNFTKGLLDKNSLEAALQHCEKVLASDSHLKTEAFDERTDLS